MNDDGTARGWRERALGAWDYVLYVCEVVRLGRFNELLDCAEGALGACGRLERRVAELESELG